MKRKIIKIDEDLCNGCGLCIPNCPEGALRIIDGKARLISDLFCDGLGACIGHCPEGAILIEEREAEPYDEAKVMANVVKAGANTIKAHLEHLQDHGETQFLKEAIDYLKENDFDVPDGFEVSDKPTESPHSKQDQGPELHFHAGCPGSRTIDFSDKKEAQQSNTEDISSELRQWPVQLQLINPAAPYFRDSDLLIAADCVPFAFADFHRKFLKDKSLIIFCPKLDTVIEQYVEKLTVLFANNKINSISILYMEVPCCFGVKGIIQRAMEDAGKDIPLEEIKISLKGDIM